MTRWFDDVTIGQAFPLGSHTFTEAEIVRFGKAYDPQYFHTDPEAARHSIFGGLVASGVHVVAMAHRKMVDALAAEAERIRELGEEPGISGPSPGVERLDFSNPVRPGDTVDFTLTVTAKRPSASLPGWGLLFNTITGTNQRGETVYTGRMLGFSRMRG